MTSEDSQVSLKKESHEQIVVTEEVPESEQKSEEDEEFEIMEVIEELEGIYNLNPATRNTHPGISPDIKNLKSE